MNHKEKHMMYAETKIYHDGSHYVAIPKTFVRRKRKVILPEEPATAQSQLSALDDGKPHETKKEAFDRLYEESKQLDRHERRQFIEDNMQSYFSSPDETSGFVTGNISRKRKNLINRKVRFARKANINEFNYFVTITRDDALMDEDTFKRKLKRCLENYHTHHNWTYMGVWERSHTGRLHLHAFMNIPDSTMPGTLEEISSYSTTNHKMQTTLQNTHFAKRFGRNDFKPLPDVPQAKSNAIKYLTKYMEKTDERMIYSHGLPTYLISDVDDKDVLAKLPNDYNPKLVLHDNFTCWDEGEDLGSMSKETKKHMRTTTS